MASAGLVLTTLAVLFILLLARLLQRLAVKRAARAIKEFLQRIGLDYEVQSSTFSCQHGQREHPFLSCLAVVGALQHPESVR